MSYEINQAPAYQYALKVVERLTENEVKIFQILLTIESHLFLNSIDDPFFSFIFKPDALRRLALLIPRFTAIKAVNDPGLMVAYIKSPIFVDLRTGFDCFPPN